MQETKRPVLHLPRSSLERGLDALAVLMLAATILIVVVNWSQLPARLPMHFGISGKPDAYGDRGTLIELALLSAALVAALSFTQRFPHRFNYLVPITARNAARQYALARAVLSWLKLELAVLFALITWQIIQIGEGHSHDLSAAFAPVTIGVLGITTALYLLASRLER